MKKILVLFTMIFSLFIITGCVSKSVLTDNELTNKLRQNGYEVNDISNEIEDSNIKSVKNANYKNKYQIEYYIFISDEICKKAYDNNSNNFKQNIKFKGKEKKSSNYSRYDQQTNDNYNVIARKGNTLIYVSVNVDYKSNIKKTLKKLGY